MGLLYQFIGTAIICTMGINMGVIFAWPAFTLILFGSPETPLNRPMTDTEIALFGSISSIGGLLSTPTAGYLLEKFGRRNSAIANTLLLVVVWALLSFSKQVEVVLAALFLSGACSAVILIASVYIGEICQDSIRGSMTATNMVSYGIGMLLSYLLGGYLQYQVMLYAGLSLSVAGVGALFLLKESPMHLLNNGKEKEAKASIAFYRNLKMDSKELIEELENMKRALNSDLGDETPEAEAMVKPEMQPAKKLSLWKFIKKSQSSRRAFVVTLVVMTAAIYQGLVVVQIYAEPLFREAIPNASTTLCTVMLAVVMVISGMIAAYLTDLLGRRPLMIYASLGSAICCLVLGTQLQFHWAPNWVTAVFLYVFCVTYTFGAGTVPFVLMAEVFLPEVKSFFSMILMEYMWICNFIILFIFNPLLKAAGWGPVFYVFASICLFSSAFCVFFLPETKGLTLDAIQALFTTKRKVPNIY